MPPKRPWHKKGKRAMALTEVAKETLEALPEIMKQLPGLDASKVTVHVLKDLPALDQTKCPGFMVQKSIGQGQYKEVKGHKTEVVNDDTLDTAIQLAKETAAIPTNTTVAPKMATRVAVLNLASERHPGGGWLNGALAQEESICYRTSLSMSLHRRLYPIEETTSLHTPDVVIIRHAFGDGHDLIHELKPEELDVVSVISVAALRRPETMKHQTIIGSVITERDVFKRPEDRELTKAKMRLTLHVAAWEGHTKLVLGALGCGAFKNPCDDVALCWREVLDEEDFRGWFDRIVFAVLDKGVDGTNAGIGGKGNFLTFKDVLHDVVFDGSHRSGDRSLALP